MLKNLPKMIPIFMTIQTFDKSSDMPWLWKSIDY